jgi:hypothetical protein
MDKFVYAKTLETPLDRNGKQYTKLTDQDNQAWSIFRSDVTFLVGKSYLFTYTTNEKGFPDIHKITPLVNIFQQKALKEVSNRNDVVKNLSVFFSYAKDLVIADKVKLEEIFSFTEKIYTELNTQADKYLPKEE